MTTTVNNPRYVVRRSDLLYPDLSFRIVKVLFEVYRELGPGHQEKYIERAVAVGLTKEGLSYKEQLYVPLTFKGVHIGKNFLDFLVEDAVVLELKKGEFIPTVIYRQVEQYLRLLNKPLAIVANFTSKGVLYKRIINKNYIKNSKPIK